MSLKIKKPDRTNELSKRLLVMFTIIILYLIGLSVPLLGVEPDIDQNGIQNAENIVTTMLNGANNQKSIFTLGIMPYMNAMIFVQCFVVFRSSESKGRISQRRMNRWTGILTFFFALFYAITRTKTFDYKYDFMPELGFRILAIAQLLLGTLILFWLLEWNKKAGIGQTMPLIIINIIGGLRNTIGQHDLREYPMLLALCGIVVIIIIIAETVMIKIPVQRVSINNVHTEKNYIAYKLNIIGVMPVMFGTAVFMLPQLILHLILLFQPDNENLKSIIDRMVMTEPLGVKVFLIIIMFLAIAFSFLMLSPKEQADNLRKAGDCIVNVPSGKKTRWYLTKWVLLLSVLSGLFQSGCMAISLKMSLDGIVPTQCAMLPMNAMMISGFVCSIFFELRSYYRFDKYKFFL
ncbi:MAG: hypothetical protein K6B67_04145 [Lachnospiraceae bacterium]|nr:hypothetical protein [Lachnospiraceae bacterium]